VEASDIERIRIDVAGEGVEITREERDFLLEEFCFVAGSKQIRESLEAVGAGRAVELDGEERFRLRAALASLDPDVALPDGITRLLAALDRSPAVGVGSG
jgi:hypothetical protein